MNANTRKHHAAIRLSVAAGAVAILTMLPVKVATATPYRARSRTTRPTVTTLPT